MQFHLVHLGSGSCRIVRLVAAGILAIAFLLPRVSTAQEIIAAKSPELRALDGMRFKAGIVRADKVGEAQPLEDELMFDNGKFISMICKRFNFTPAPYWMRSDGDRVHFLAELNSPSDGKMIWEGTLTGDRLEGTMHWIKNRWYWTIDVEHKIVGVLDGPEPARTGAAPQ